MNLASLGLDGYLYIYARTHVYTTTRIHVSYSNPHGPSSPRGAGRGRVFVKISCQRNKRQDPRVHVGNSRQVRYPAYPARARGRGFMSVPGGECCFGYGSIVAYMYVRWVWKSTDLCSRGSLTSRSSQVTRGVSSR